MTDLWHVIRGRTLVGELTVRIPFDDPDRMRRAARVLEHLRDHGEGEVRAWFEHPDGSRNVELSIRRDHLDRLIRSYRGE